MQIIRCETFRDCIQRGEAVLWDEDAQNIKESFLWKDVESFYDTLLHSIARHDKEMKNDFSCLMNLIDSPILSSKNIDGCTCLHLSARYDNTSFLSSLYRACEEVALYFQLYFEQNKHLSLYCNIFWNIYLSFQCKQIPQRIQMMLNLIQETDNEGSTALTIVSIIWIL